MDDMRARGLSAQYLQDQVNYDPTARTLDLTSFDYLTLPDLQCLTTLRNLEQIKATECPWVTDATFQFFATLPNLRKLSLARCQNLTEVGIRDAIGRFGRLRYLNIKKCPQVSVHGVHDIWMHVPNSELKISSTRLKPHPTPPPTQPDPISSSSESESEEDTVLDAAAYGLIHGVAGFLRKPRPNESRAWNGLCQGLAGANQYNRQHPNQPLEAMVDRSTRGAIRGVDIAMRSQPPKGKGMGQHLADHYFKAVAEER